MGPIGPILYRLTAPMLLGVLSMVLFNAIDTYFVGQLGKTELSALSFTFAPIMILFTLIQGLGIGATALVAKSIGQGNLSKAARETTDSLVLGLIIAATFSVLGYLFLNPLFRMMGANAQELPLVVEYMEIWLVTIVFVVVPFLGNSAIRATGDARTPALIMLFAVAINAILDPLLIFGYGPFPELGIRGAALATAISRGITLVLSCWVLYRREKLITLVIPSRQTILGCWRAILNIGLPAGLSRMIVPLATMVIYSILARLENPDVVAGYGVATRVEALAASLLFALSASMGPFVGQNFGMGHYDRILVANQKANMFAVGWGIVMAILLVWLGDDIASSFTDSEGVAEVAALYLVLVPATIGFQGAVQVVNVTLNALNMPKIAAGIIALQMFGFYLPLAFLGAETRGEGGVFVSIAVAYFLGGIISMLVINRVLVRKIEAQKRQKTIEEQDSWEKKRR